MGELIAAAVGLLLLIFAFFMGKVLEVRHAKSQDAREKKLGNIIVTTMRSLPPGTTIESSTLVMGSVVVSPSYWRRFLAGFRLVVGGEVKSITFEMDRARREARLRLMRDAAKKGCNVVINTRFDTSMVSNSGGGNNKALSIVEMFAYGTGLRIPQG